VEVGKDCLSPKGDRGIPMMGTTGASMMLSEWM